MGSSDRGPLGRIRDDELVWLTPSAPLHGIVARDLQALDGADQQLLRAADTLAHAGLGSDEHFLERVLSAAVASYGELEGLSPAGELDTAHRGAAQFQDRLDARDDTLTP